MSSVNRPQTFDLLEAEAALQQLAGVFFLKSSDAGSAISHPVAAENQPTLEAQYRALVEQIPAIVFFAYLDRGIGEAYVSPQIETTLGFSQQEWLEDPVLWYQQIHPDEKQRWSIEAAEMFLSGKPLRSTYRILARDGHVVWFHCEAKMVRREDGRPWFIQGVAFDITELKQTEAALEEERNVLSTILNTVGALVVVLDSGGRIVRFNRACETTTGHSFEEVKGHCLWELFSTPEETENFKAAIEESRAGLAPDEYEADWVSRQGNRRRIAWSSTAIPACNGSPQYVIATGIDITERRRLQNTILEIGSREQRRIGQDLHDGLGQHLTGIAFMSKVLEQKLNERCVPETADAAKILKLVNEAIQKTKELARGLLPVVSDSLGLMSALKQLTTEVEDVFKISCRFQCDEAVLITDANVATQLYHIAQEAVNNSVKHGNAKAIVIQLAVIRGSGTLAIVDEGAGIEGNPANHAGMGLHIMRHRANLIGGTFHVGAGPYGGTTVFCSFPV